MRRTPDQAQPLPDFGSPQIAQLDTETAAIRKRCIVFARAGKIGVEIDGAPDIADEDERRADMIIGKRVGVFHGLALGRAHQILPQPRLAATRFPNSRLTSSA